MQVDSNDNLIIGWTAKLLDETLLTMNELGTFDRVPADRCRSVSVKISGRDQDVHVSCHPERGERIRMFTRRAIRIGPNGTNGQTINMPVLEVKTEGQDDIFFRLYVHPQHGCIFSTLDLNL